MTRARTLLLLGLVGFASLLLAGTALAAGDAATPSGGSDITPWLSGGGGAAAVGGLVYVARMVIKGELVPRSVAAQEAELNAGIRASGEREAALMKVAEDCQRQTACYHQLALEQQRTNGKTEQLLTDVLTALQQRGTS